MIRHGRVLERRFRIRWKGFDHRSDTFEPESNLDGCLDILQKYLRDNNMPRSNIRGLLGADSEAQVVNKFNWCPMSVILDKVFIYKSIKYNDVSLEIEVFD